LKKKISKRVQSISGVVKNRMMFRGRGHSLGKKGRKTERSLGKKWGKNSHGGKTKKGLQNIRYKRI